MNSDMMLPRMVQHAAMPGTFIIQSHRGAGVLAPENSLEAFELAWQMETWPECDLRTTRDGVIVTFHDADFRQTNREWPPDLRNKSVREMTWLELASISPASRLDNVLARMRGRPERRLYLDVKDVNLNQLAEIVRRHEVAGQVVFSSTDYDLIQQWNR